MQLVNQQQQFNGGESEQVMYKPTQSQSKNRSTVAAA